MTTPCVSETTRGTCHLARSIGTAVAGTGTMLDVLARLEVDGFDIEPGRCDLGALREAAETVEGTGALPWWVEACRPLNGPHGPRRDATRVARDLRLAVRLLGL